MTPNAVIAGIGTSKYFGLSLELSPLRLQFEAFADALADSGLAKDDVDAIATSHGSPGGVDYDEFVLAAGLDVRWVSQKWSHGRWAATTVAEAALAVEAGLAECVAVVNTATSARGYGRHLAGFGAYGAREGMRDTGGSHGEWDIHGIDTPGAATALVARHYMDRYGATDEDLARVAIAFRQHARLNPMAIMRDKPMTAESYYAEPMIARPFRRPDFCLDSEGATCLLICDRRRAAELRQPLVAIAAVTGIHASRDDHILFARPGLGVGLQATRFRFEPELEVFRRADISPADVDGLYVYDSFSSNLWMVLERFGFCAAGDAPAYVRDTGIGPGSARPVNTNGGLLSEAHLSGYGHLVEMVRQLRGQAGQRQIKEAAVLQWATPRGDSLILTKGGLPVTLPYLVADPGPAPVVHPGNAFWWQALAKGDLRLPRCIACGTIRFPPTEACWRCLSFGYELAELTTSGTVAACVVIERVTRRSRWRAGVPYRTGLVEFDGIRLPGRILCACGGADTPGAPVTAALLQTEDGPPVLGFAHSCVG